MAKVKMTAAVTSQVQLAEGIYDLRLAAGEIAAQAVPGQFVSLYSKDGSRLLPRPISLCGIDKEKGELRLVYRVAGAGTKEFSALTAGDTIDVLGPLGNGFPLLEGKKAFLDVYKRQTFVAKHIEEAPVTRPLIFHEPLTNEPSASADSRAR